MSGRATTPSASVAPSWEPSGRLLAVAKSLRHATVDIDATILPATKKESLRTSRFANGTRTGERGYQPLNCALTKLGGFAWSEMRDGNVPAKEGNAQQVLKRARARLPAGHSAEVFRFCNRPKARPAAQPRIKAIPFAISAVRSPELMGDLAAVPERHLIPRRVLEKWAPGGGGKVELVEVDSADESLAEVKFVSNADGYSRRDEIIRYVARRRKLSGSLGLDGGELPAEVGNPAHAFRR